MEENKIDGELLSGNENVITDLGEQTPVEEVEVFEGLDEIIDEFEETPNADGSPEIKTEEKTSVDSNKEIKGGKETSAYEDIVAHYQSKGWLGDVKEYEDEDFTFDGSDKAFEILMERKAERDAFDILYKDILPQLPSSVRKKVELMFEDELDAVSADQLGDKIDTYSSLNKQTFEQDTSKAKETYTAYLKSKGFDDEEIEDAVTKAVDLDEIVEKAEKARVKLLEAANKEVVSKKEQEKVEEARRAQAEVQKLQSMKASINAFREQINKQGFPVNEKIEGEIFKSRTEIVGKTEDNRPLNKVGALSQKDPEGFQNALHLLAAMDYFSLDKNGKVKPNFDKLTKSAQSSAVKKVGANIEKITSKFATVGTKSKSELDNDDDVLSELNQIFN